MRSAASCTLLLPFAHVPFTTPPRLCPPNVHAARPIRFNGGDVGYIDDEGVIWFSDRTKDMVKSGGENISSVEVERITVGYKDVAECTIVGIPDECWGEAVLALVVLNPGRYDVPQPAPSPTGMRRPAWTHNAAP